MPIHCPTCQAENSADSRFCFRCGSVLSPNAPSAPTEVLLRNPAPPALPADPLPISGAPVAPPAWGPPAARPAMTTPAYPGPPGPPAPPVIVPGPPSAPPAPARARPLMPLALGCIGVGAALMLLAVGLLVFGAVLRPGPAGGPARPVPTTVAGTTLDSAIRAAVDASNTAQIAALHNLDETPFQGVVTGTALLDNLQILENLRRTRSYAVSTLDHIEYQPAKQLDADHASIRTTESWTTRYYRQGTTQLTRTTQSTGLQEIYYLVRQNGHWVVEQIDIRDPGATPAPNNTQ